MLSVPFVPGPGLFVMLLGLGILSLEFQRPRIWLARMKAEGLKPKTGYGPASGGPHQGAGREAEKPDLRKGSPRGGD